LMSYEFQFDVFFGIRLGWLEFLMFDP
jgi:hypothetical protein